MVERRFEIIERLPTVDEYFKLRQAVGWRNLSVEATATGLSKSLYSVCLFCDHCLIGFGRIVGDGGLVFYVQDIIVLPDFQGQGHGKRIMDAIMAYLKQNAPEGAFIGLMAAKDKEGFYLPYGFNIRPGENYGPGMGLVWKSG
jgi:ribosomal protein S18 acetylase RimI-like enzyme